MTTDSEQQSAPAAKPGFNWMKPAVLAAVAVAFGLAYFQFGNQLSLKSLAQQETRLRDYSNLNPLVVNASAFVIYVAVTGLSLPGAAAMSLVVGWFFGFAHGVILVSFASTTGATLAFLLSRYLFRDALQNKFGDRLATFNESLEREGAFYLFTLRLIPAVPFFVINVVMSLTKMKATTFWWVSQLGMLPGTCAFIWAGSTMPNLATLAKKGASGIITPQLFAAFVVLGVFPLAVKKIMQATRGQKTGAPLIDDWETETQDPRIDDQETENQDPRTSESPAPNVDDSIDVDGSPDDPA
ncbi:MAG: TVP38/TMEM64 family protein [Planctomycetales bacterium]